MSGGMDCLVNVYDLKTIAAGGRVDDAIVHILSCEASFSRLLFFGPSYEFIAGLTHSETLG